jgi:uncharacterized protein with NRDE domain
MCLIACAWRVHPRFELLLIANRDEYHARPTAAAAISDDAPHVVGGHDLQAGGGWLQLSSRRRLAAVTNVRDGAPAADRPRSRGALVARFVRDAGTALDFARRLADEADAYGRFNLLLWDGAGLRLASNHPRHAHIGLLPGIHVLSNGPFGARWPKTERIRQGLAAWLDAAQPDGDDLDALFALLADRSPADEAGIGREREPLLAPVFIANPIYGTRCSSVVTVMADGRWRFVERRFAADGCESGHSTFSGAMGVQQA